MLSQTKENIADLINKIERLDFVMQKLNLAHKDDGETIEKLFKRAASHKLVLIDELLRLEGVA